MGPRPTLCGTVYTSGVSGKKECKTPLLGLALFCLFAGLAGHHDCGDGFRVLSWTPHFITVKDAHAINCRQGNSMRPAFHLLSVCMSTYVTYLSYA